LHYRFGFSSSGETLVILTIPTLSCAVEIDVTCHLVPNLRRDVMKKMKNKNVGKTFEFSTPDNHVLKVCNTYVNISKYILHILFFNRLQ
jgi:hypothetical protein